MARSRHSSKSEGGGSGPIRAQKTHFRAEVGDLA
jgi:hypothetical protein